MHPPHGAEGVSTDNSPLASLDEGEQLGSDFRSGMLGRDFFTRLLHIQVRTVKQPVGITERPGGLGGETSALQPNLVDATNLGGIPVGDHEWRHILHNFRAAPDNRVPTEPAKLMHAGEPPDNRMVFDHHMTGDRAVVGKNHMVTDHAIVGNMLVGEEISMTADDRLRPR